MMIIKYQWKNLSELEEKVLDAKKTGNIYSKEYIINFFMPYIQKTSKSYFIRNFDNEDIKQHLIVSLLHAIKSYNLSNKFFWYAMNTMRNSIYSELKKRKKEDSFLNIDELILTSDENSLDFNILNEEKLKTLRESLLYLNENELMLVYNYYYLNKKLKQISSDNNLNYNTLATQKSRTLKKLKNIYLNTYYGGQVNV